VRRAHLAAEQQGKRKERQRSVIEPFAIKKPMCYDDLRAEITP